MKRNSTAGRIGVLWYLPVMKQILVLFSIGMWITPYAREIEQNSLNGRTTGRLPYLEYGLGDDRLGGARMGYLDTAIAVRIIDSAGSDFKVKLSANHTAWLPKRNFRVDTSLNFRDFYLSSSWSVFGDEKYDYVKVSLDERLPYRSIQQINPSRIIVDIFGVTSNTNWITQLKTVKEISNVYYEQLEDDVFRIIIDLRHSQHWGHSVYYEKNRLVIRIKQQPARLKLRNLKIAIDAGHGGDNSGATGISGAIKEKDYTLLMAQQLEKELRKRKATVFMTRTTDTSLGMIERTEMLRAEEPDLLISIHLNSSSRDSVKGTSTYYRHIGFRPLSRSILERMLDLGLKEYGNIGSFNFSLSGPTEYPNCLVEVAFLSNKDDERLIMNPKFHRKVADRIADGIKDWLKQLR